MKKYARKRRGRRSRRLESPAVGEAYGDALYAAARARIEDLMRRPEWKRRFERSILDALEVLVAGLKEDIVASE